MAGVEIGHAFAAVTVLAAELGGADFVQKPNADAGALPLRQDHQSTRSHGVADLGILLSRIKILGTSWAQLVTIFKKPICRSPSRGYFVACTEAEKQEALHYLDSVLTEVGDRRRALAETDPLERQERLF